MFVCSMEKSEVGFTNIGCHFIADTPFAELLNFLV